MNLNYFHCNIIKCTKIYIHKTAKGAIIAKHIKSNKKTTTRDTRQRPLSQETNLADKQLNKLIYITKL